VGDWFGSGEVSEILHCCSRLCMFTSLLPALLVVVGAGVFLVYLYCCLLALLGVECVVVAVPWWQGPSPVADAWYPLPSW